jgi:hypothetical protein
MTTQRKLTIFLGVIQAIVAIGAIPAGFIFVADPSGKGMGNTTDLLAHSPFHTFLIPGLFLMIVNGFGNLAGAVLSFMNRKIAGLLGYLLGVVLFTWVIFQVAWIGYGSWLQALFFFVGIAETILGYMIWKRSSRQIPA